MVLQIGWNTDQYEGSIGRSYAILKNRMEWVGVRPNQMDRMWLSIFITAWNCIRLCSLTLLSSKIKAAMGCRFTREMLEGNVGSKCCKALDSVAHVIFLLYGCSFFHLSFNCTTFYFFQGFPFLFSQIRDNINIKQTCNLIFSLCRWNDGLALAVSSIRVILLFE